MNPYANIDVLYTIKCLETEYKGLFQHEIQNILYLASLLSLYDGNPLSDWGYYFLSIDNMPFCEDIPEQLTMLERNGFIMKDNGKYKLTNNGLDFLDKTSDFSYSSAHKKYIDCCTDSVLSIPLPLLTNSINNESMLMDIKNTPRRELLGDGLLFNLLYKDIEGIQQVVANEKSDLWIISTLWIKYLSSIDTKEHKID